MKQLIARFEAIQRGGPQLVSALLGIGGLTAVLLLAAVVGALTVGGDDKEQQLQAGSSAETTTTVPGDIAAVDPAATDTTIAGDPAAPTDPGAVPAPGAATATTKPGTKPGTAAPTASGTGTAAPTAGGGGTTAVTEAPPAPGEAPLPKGGSTVGVTATAIKYGVHGPQTFNKAPVPLAGPVVRGIRTYVNFLNKNGGINGRQINLKIADDEFTTEGADSAGNRLINDEKVFFLAGTLGVDQIRVVAGQAKKAGVPYFAGGGHEPQFKDFGVHQILSSYDTHATKLAEFMGKDPKYAGKNVGVIVSDTPLIHPNVTNIFRTALEANGLKLTAVQTVQKPEVQSATGYGGIALNFAQNKVQVVVPLTDPINTSGLVRQCTTQGGCAWTYSFSNFAHDGETALTLFNDEWGNQKVKGLSGGCYPNAPDAQINDTAKCGSMGKAKSQFVAERGAGSWTATQNDEDGASLGYNSAAGYQWVGYFTKAMKDVGSEVTRERFIAAADRYEGYGDLITGPITYKGVNPAHGAEKMVVWEAQTGNKYKMVSEGFVDGF